MEITQSHFIKWANEKYFCTFSAPQVSRLASKTDGLSNSVQAALCAYITEVTGMDLKGIKRPKDIRPLMKPNFSPENTKALNFAGITFYLKEKK
jgi:hypothetical protein